MITNVTNAKAVKMYRVIEFSSLLNVYLNPYESDRQQSVARLSRTATEFPHSRKRGHIGGIERSMRESKGIGLVIPFILKFALVAGLHQEQSLL